MTFNALSFINKDVYLSSKKILAKISNLNWGGLDLTWNDPDAITGEIRICHKSKVVSTGRL